MSIRLDAIGDRLTRDTSLPSSINSTWMAHVYPVSELVSFPVIYLMHNAGASPQEVYTAGQTWWIFGTGGSFQGTPWSLNTWYHLALTFGPVGANSMKLYVNGTLNVQANNTSSYSPTKLVIGDFTAEDGSNRFNGRIAACKMWGAVLSQAEIAAEMGFYQPQRLTNVHSWSKMRTPSEVNDESGNGRHWTPLGSLTTEADPPGVVDQPSGGGFQIAWAGPSSHYIG